MKSKLRERERIVTIANGLSLLRALLTIPLVWALETDRMSWVLIMVVAAIISDYLDGYLARKAHAITDLGKLLDPIADKFIMLGVMVFLIMDEERQFPIIFFILLGIRDITIVNIGTYLMERRQEVFQSNLAGKWFVGVSSIALTLYILRYIEIGYWVLLIAMSLMMISWVMYLRRYLKYFKSLQA